MGNLLQQLALLGALMLSGEQGLGHGVPCCSAAWGAHGVMGLVRDDGGRVQTGHQGLQGCILGITWQSLAHCVSFVLPSWLCHPEPCPYPGYVLSVHSIIVSMCPCECLPVPNL